MTKITLQNIIDKKSRGEKITMLTAYDYPTARCVDRAGIDIILIGDSLANVVLGLDSTTEIGMDVMLSHAKAVARAVEHAFVVADMPFDAYQPAEADEIKNAFRLIDEAGCQAVKVEWFPWCEEVVKSLRGAGIEVMGHVGLTPQTAQEFKVQGRDSSTAEAIMQQAKLLEEAGCFAIVLECVPEDLAREITQELKVPTIGIGAGKFCDGQVLVLHDMLGLTDRKVPKFVKKYTDLSAEILKAVQLYKEDVEAGTFPGPEQSFH
jgi:3-methyl-2-oxobutanoate hydroxymethyltransferase